ncbi:MFS family permease [Staphylococcus capitis]
MVSYIFYFATEPFFGRMINNLGDSLYYVLSMWFVYYLSHSNYYTGITGFLILLPEVFQFLVGPIISKFSIKKILIIIQILQSLFLIAIPILYYFQLLNIFVLLSFIFISSCLNQFNYPAHIQLLPYIVPKSYITKANSLLTIAYQGTDTIFNSLSGILISLVGVFYLYVYNSILFVVAACLFLFLKVPDFSKDNSSLTLKKFYLDIYDGFKFVFSSIIIKLLVGFLLLNFASGITLAILPDFSLNKGGESYYYGFYLASLSIGALLGALSSNYFDRFPLGKLHIFMFFFSSLCFIFTIYSNITFSILFFTLTWVPIGISNVLLLSTAQKIINVEKIGNVYTVINSLSIAIMPVGSLFAAIISKYINSHFIMLICAILVLLVSIIWISIKELRILPKTDKINL